jgi:hypothetical protein
MLGDDGAITGVRMLTAEGEVEMPRLDS